MDRADELFALAIEQSPTPLPLRLARDLRERHTKAVEWPEVARLGHALSPDEPLFAGDRASLEGGHYGPWPDMPNWIQASWDLTPEVLAVDFHHVISGSDARDQRAIARRAA